MILDFYQSLHENKVLSALLASENKQTIPKVDFKAIGTCRKAINIRRIVIIEGFFVFNTSFFFEVNLLIGV